MRLNETTQAYFQRLADISPPDEAARYRSLEDPAKSESVQEYFAVAEPRHHSMLRTSISPNIIRGGFWKKRCTGLCTFTLKSWRNWRAQRIKSTLTRLAASLNVQRNYGTNGIDGIDGKHPLDSVVSVNSVCSVVSPTRCRKHRLRCLAAISGSNLRVFARRRGWLTRRE
jgi:hypothetical protein